MTSFRHDEPGTRPETWAADPRWAAVASGAPWADDPAVTRVVVVAAHPDDETLGAGGLIASAHDHGLRVDLVLLTAGEASHPESPTHPAHVLRARRLDEAEHALRILAPGAATTFLDLPDGGVDAAEDTVLERLVELVGDGRDTVLVSPWHRDGHPDHDAAGRAARVAAARTGARCWHYPVWFWHWGSPDDAPWPDLVGLALPPAAHARKRSALAAHRSQVEPLSDQPGDEVLLPEAVLAHFRGAREVFVRERGSASTGGAGPDTALDALHRSVREPWGADERWYEERKRALLLAALPARSFTRGLEIGSSTGVLAGALAGRCDELVAVDSSPAALAGAARRLASQPHVALERHDVPWSWPDGAFDLVVISETGYFWSPAALDGVLDRLAGALTHDGVLVLCHWRHPVVGWPLDGPDVHRRVLDAALRPEIARYRDRDVEILVLADPRRLPDPAT